MIYEAIISKYFSWTINVTVNVQNRKIFTFTSKLVHLPAMLGNLSWLCYYRARSPKPGNVPYVDRLYSV